MAKKQYVEQATPDQIIEVMEPDAVYFTGDIADLLGLQPMSIVEVMKKMKAQGFFLVCQKRGKTTYQIKPAQEAAGPRYQPPSKPLTGYDPGALMRLCNSGRKAETGMA